MDALLCLFCHTYGMIYAFDEMFMWIVVLILLLNNYK